MLLSSIVKCSLYSILPRTYMESHRNQTIPSLASWAADFDAKGQQEEFHEARDGVVRLFKSILNNINCTNCECFCWSVAVYCYDSGHGCDYAYGDVWTCANDTSLCCTCFDNNDIRCEEIVCDPQPLCSFGQRLVTEHTDAFCPVYRCVEGSLFVRLFILTLSFSPFSRVYSKS